jgi:hypothetical protein
MIRISPVLDEVLRMFRVVPLRRAAARMLPLLGALQLLSAVAIAAVQNAPVCVASYDQFPPAMVPNGTGGALVAWADYRSTDLDIFVQSTNSAGLSLWTSDGVPMCKVAGAQINPRIVADGGGGGVVVWQDGRSGTAYDIYAQRVSAVGQGVWAPGGIPVCTAAGVQELPQVVADGFGGTIIGWVDRRGADADIYVQRLDASGNPQWTADGVALCAATGNQTDLALVPDDLGGAIALWKDGRGATPDIYAQRVSVGGVAQWAAGGAVVCGVAGEQRAPQLIADGAGGAIAVWSDARGGAGDVYVQRMSGAGAIQWAADGVAVCVAVGDQVAPRLCGDGAGGAIVTWQDNRGGATSDIYAQRVTVAGAAQWTANGIVVCAAAAAQASPAISADEAGGAVISWSDGRTVVNGADIYAQRVSGAGAPMWAANGVALCDTTGDQDSPAVVWNGAGGAAAVWRDYRGGPTADLYLQSVDAGGAVPGQCPAATTLLAESSAVTALSAQNFYDIPITNYYWSGVGVRSPAGTDWDLEFYSPLSYGTAPYPTCFGSPLAGSYGSSAVDFVIANFNPRHTPPDTYGARATRYSGSGSGTVEWDFTATVITKDCSGGACGGKSSNGWTGVLDVWDVRLLAGQTYTFDFTHTGSADIKMLLFTSNGVEAPYSTSRSGRIFETTDRYTVYAAPTTEYYGVVLVNDNGLSGTYLVKVLTGIPVGVGDGARPRTGLLGVTPNPAHGEAEVRFSLSEPGEVSFRVVDTAGRVVGTIPRKPWGVGTWSLRWDGRGADGSSLSAGVYFLQMQLNGQKAGVQRLALVR